MEAIGRITPGYLGLYDDATEAALKPVLASIRKHSKIAVAMQLAHAGRKGRAMRHGMAASKFRLTRVAGRPRGRPRCRISRANWRRSRSMRRGWRAFAMPLCDAAKRAERLGLDALELHCAHGYLLHEFLSPISNQRSDRYGGSLENRLRFPLEVFDAVRAAFPSRQAGRRQGVGDRLGRGRLGPCADHRICQALKQRGVDWIDASSGGVSPLQKIPLGPGYQVPFAQAMKQATGVTTIAVGLITKPNQAEEIVASGKADMVALARGMLYDPRWGWHAAAELGGQVEAPPQYWRSQPSTQKALFGKTTFGAR